MNIDKYHSDSQIPGKTPGSCRAPGSELPLAMAWKGRFILYPALLVSLIAVLVLGNLCILGPVYSSLSLDKMGSGKFLQRHMGLTAATQPSNSGVQSVQQRQKSYWPAVRDLARKHGLDPAVVMAVIQVESHFRPNAVSPVGAKGLMQIAPGTAKHLGLENPLDPHANLRAGIRYLAQLKKRFGGKLVLILAAYNAGPTKVKSLGRVPRLRETRNYVRRVMRQVDYFRDRFMTLASS